MGLFNKGNAKIHCPGCGAKNDAAAERCRICTGFMENEDGSLRGLQTGLEGGASAPADERGIAIPGTTSTIPADESSEETAAPPPLGQIDDEAFDVDALDVDFRQQSIAPVQSSAPVETAEPSPTTEPERTSEPTPVFEAPQTMTEALPEFDEEERVGAVEPVAAQETELVDIAELPPPPSTEQPEPVPMASKTEDVPSRTGGRLELGSLQSRSGRINSPNATFDRIGFDENESYEPIPTDDILETAPTPERTSAYQPF